MEEGSESDMERRKEVGAKFKIINFKIHFIKC